MRGPTSVDPHTLSFQFEEQRIFFFKKKTKMICCSLHQASCHHPVKNSTSIEVGGKLGRGICGPNKPYFNPINLETHLF